MHSSKKTNASARDVAPDGKKSSFRKLKAFGLWADRRDLTDPIQFTRQLRARMEQRRR
jgi:hypothetical protein